MQDQFLQATRLEAVGKLAGGVAHEFNNLLTVINGSATLLAETVDGGAPAELAEDIRRAGERAADLSGQLLTISRPKAVVPQPMDLNASVRNTTRLIGRTIGDQITIDLDTDVELPVVKADPGLVSQIIFNLMLNARDAMPLGGTITIRTVTLTEAGTTWARLSVTDTGTGMTEEVRARMFEPFFTTKGVGKGTGLGLAIVHAHVLSLGGRIRCETALGRGTTFHVDLPTTTSITDDMTPLPPALSLPPPLSSEFATVVMVVEDDDAVLSLAKKILELRGMTVLPAHGPDDAIRASDEYRDRIDLLLTDLSMPEMSGRELADQLRARRPGLRVMYMSGFTADEAIDRGLLHESAAL
jgi:CheY-like chemotaxis protein